MSHVGNGARPDALWTTLIGLAQLIPGSVHHAAQDANAEGLPLQRYAPI
jgi:hypothetical protein